MARNFLFGGSGRKARHLKLHLPQKWLFYFLLFSALLSSNHFLEMKFVSVNLFSTFWGKKLGGTLSPGVHNLTVDSLVGTRVMAACVGSHLSCYAH